MEWSDEIKGKVEKLEKKYAASGQDLGSYLDGLLYTNPLHYWDYTCIDTLLSLQHPKTDFPDEEIFIIYHQITELYFKLALNEIEQIAHNGKNISNEGQDLGWKNRLEVDFFIARVKRINNYFEALSKSFSIMVHGMEKEQFLKFERFRRALRKSAPRKSQLSNADFIKSTSTIEARLKSDSTKLPSVKSALSRIHLLKFERGWLPLLSNSPAWF